MIEAAQIPKILIAGVGNELRQDDAFGLLLIRELLKNIFEIKIGEEARASFIGL